ncbi:patatin-like phospholipase family protein [Rhizobium etli]|uniref:Putative acylesterase/phospholipase RssA n=1 Tax=Rhizobium etli TaxID=29449 RepID=A0A7W6ZFT3_RHIET|nr:patatin-like phospholipase family protein [Rhizobium etli]MBB4478967.1 putative acylesterase/phospholipase RssA [Rhizobium etli]MBB4534839.1 putative acylesterase/phospholipase RssA [Rhizobium etli]
MADLAADKPFRVLTLDGGGAKGFYTLGVLHEVEAMLGKPIHEAFDLIFGTSTGAIIGTLLAIGTPVSKIHELYRKHVPDVMRPKDKARRSAALRKLGDEIFKEQKFDAAKTGLGVVATKWVMETPIIFKSDPKQAHGRAATFVPGFGCTLSDAVQASCSAYPFFTRRQLKINGDEILLLDGGFCANNPTLYAIADAVRAYKVPHERIKVLNVGVGDYPVPRLKKFTKAWHLLGGGSRADSENLQHQCPVDGAASPHPVSRHRDRPCQRSIHRTVNGDRPSRIRPVQARPDSYPRPGLIRQTGNSDPDAPALVENSCLYQTSSFRRGPITDQ